LTAGIEPNYTVTHFPLSFFLSLFFLSFLVWWWCGGWKIIFLKPNGTLALPSSGNVLNRTGIKNDDTKKKKK
jgi:hypothetical protein